MVCTKMMSRITLIDYSKVPVPSIPKPNWYTKARKEFMDVIEGMECDWVSVMYPCLTKDLQCRIGKTRGRCK